VAIFVTGVGFYVIGRRSASPLRLVLSGIFMGLGIAGMALHRHGGDAGHAELSYDPLFVALSVVIAIGASTAATMAGIPNHGALARSSVPRSSWAWPFPVCTTRG